jgi:hypothetical protein
MDWLREFVGYWLDDSLGGLAVLLGASVAALVVLLLIGNAIAWTIARKNRLARRARTRSDG